MEFLFHAPSELLTSIALDKQLYELHLGLKWSPSSTWDPKPEVLYLPVVNDDHTKVYGMFSFQPLTDKMLDVHIYVLPKYWGTNISKDMVKLMFTYLKEETEFNILLTACPGPAKIAQNFCKNWAKLDETVIFKNGMTYFDEVVDLHQYMGYIR